MKDATAGVVVATIVARNYGALAEVMLASVRAADPAPVLATLVLDGEESDRATPGLGEVWLPQDLGLSPDELEPMILSYSVIELATALKPAFLRALRARYEVAVYLDPDIEVLTPLADVVVAARDHAVALVPHQLSPLPRDGRDLSERAIMHSGIFNLGFVAVGPGSEAFLDWWHERLRTDALIDIQRALFTDQRWIDWVPALFEHVVLRDPGLDVAYWNLHERPLSRAADGTLLAGGVPVRFLHWSGFEADRPWVLSHYQGEHPRVLVSESAVLAEACNAYAERLRASGHDDRRRSPYRFERLSDGTLLSASLRALYRSSLLGLTPFPAPPTRPLSDPASLVAWLAQETPVDVTTDLSPADLIRWEARPDLRLRFPEPYGADAAGLRAALAEPDEVAARSAGGLPPRAAETEPAAVTWLVAAIGSPEPCGEVTEVARRVAATLAGGGGVLLAERHQGRRSATGEVGVAGWRRVRLGAPGVGDATVAAGVVLCVDADRLAPGPVRAALGSTEGVRIGYWFTARPQDVRHHAVFFAALDQVWVPDEALATAVRDVTATPVVVVPLPPAPAEEDPGPVLEVDARVLDPGIGTAVREHAGSRTVRVRYGRPTPRLIDDLSGSVGRVEVDGDTWPRPAPALVGAVSAPGATVALADRAVDPVALVTAAATVLGSGPRPDRAAPPVDLAEPRGAATLAERETARVTAALDRVAAERDRAEATRVAAEERLTADVTRLSDTAARQKAAIAGLVGAVSEQMIRAGAAEQELARLRATRLFRWSAAPRRAWGRARRVLARGAAR